MAALIIVDLTATDEGKLSTYSAMVAETLVSYGGEYLSKGAINTVHSEAVFQTKEEIQLPDRDSATHCYHSESYQQIISTRDQVMENQFHPAG